MINCNVYLRTYGTGEVVPNIHYNMYCLKSIIVSFPCNKERLVDHFTRINKRDEIICLQNYLYQSLKKNNTFIKYLCFYV